VAPGITTIILISVVNMWLLRDNKEVLVAHKRTSAEKWELFKTRGKLAIPALMLPVIVLGGIYGGIMTTTEASAMAVIYSIPVGVLVYKGMKWREVIGPLVESAVTTGVIMAMLFSVSMLSRLYLLEDLPSRLLALFRMVSENRWVILFMINIFLVIMGMLMDDISVVVLTTPIMMPIIMELGFNPIHYAAIIGVNTALGCITPPAAPVLYLSGRLSKTPINEMMTPALYFMLLCWGPVLIFTSYFPKLVLFLPHVVLGTPW